MPTGWPGQRGRTSRGWWRMLFAEDLPFLTGETIYIDGAQGMAH